MIQYKDAKYKDCAELKSVKIPKWVTSVGEGAFSGSGLETLEFDEGFKGTIATKAFFLTQQLVSVHIPDGVSSIGDQAFSNSGLTALTFGEGFAGKIGQEAFFNTQQLSQELRIPAGATVDQTAFR